MLADPRSEDLKANYSKIEEIMGKMKELLTKALRNSAQWSRIKSQWRKSVIKIG